MATIEKNFHPTIQPTRHDAIQSARVNGVSAYERSTDSKTCYVVRAAPRHYVKADLISQNPMRFIFEYDPA